MQKDQGLGQQTLIWIWALLYWAEENDWQNPSLGILPAMWLWTSYATYTSPNLVIYEMGIKL